MTPPTPHSARASARRQHHNITRKQLLELGYTVEAIRHRLSNGRLHEVFRGVYAVDRPHDTISGLLMAAVLRCGPGAVLSHASAAALWAVRRYFRLPIEVTVPAHRTIEEPRIRVHRSRTLGPGEVAERNGIPVTTVVRTLVDVAPDLSRAGRERAINEADRLGLIDPERLREELSAGRRHRDHILRETLDRRTFTKTRSDLERDFIPLARAAGLPRPVTQPIVNGYEVDFYWPELGLVVESDGLRYHRTPAQQAKDRLRDQSHTAAGLTPLRFTDEQIDFEQAHVIETLRATARRLAQ